MELENKIAKLQKKLKRKIKYINRGGCIQFAYYFSKTLRELKVEHKVVFIDDEPISLTYNGFIPPTHVLIHIPNIGYIDGHDLYPRFGDIRNEYFEEEYQRHVNISLKKLNKFRTSYSWNRTYDAQKHNKTIEQTINKTFNVSRRNLS